MTGILLIDNNAVSRGFGFVVDYLKYIENLKAKMPEVDRWEIELYDSYTDEPTKSFRKFCDIIGITICQSRKVHYVVGNVEVLVKTYVSEMIIRAISNLHDVVVLGTNDPLFIPVHDFLVSEALKVYFYAPVDSTKYNVINYEQ